MPRHVMMPRHATQRHATQRPRDVTSLNVAVGRDDAEYDGAVGCDGAQHVNNQQGVVQRQRLETNTAHDKNHHGGVKGGAGEVCACASSLHVRELVML